MTHRYEWKRHAAYAGRKNAECEIPKSSRKATEAENGHYYSLLIIDLDKLSAQVVEVDNQRRKIVAVHGFRRKPFRSFRIRVTNGTRSSATAKSTARPSCLVGVLHDILMANQPLLRNSPRDLSNSAK